MCETRERNKIKGEIERGIKKRQIFIEMEFTLSTSAWLMADREAAMMKLQGFQMSNDCTFSFSIPNIFFHVVV